MSPTSYQAAPPRITFRLLTHLGRRIWPLYRLWTRRSKRAERCPIGRRASSAIRLDLVRKPTMSAHVARDSAAGPAHLVAPRDQRLARAIAGCETITAPIQARRPGPRRHPRDDKNTPTEDVKLT